MLQNYNMLPLMVGSLPYTDPAKACEKVKQYFDKTPCWPQLPVKDPREGMIQQVVNGLPGISVVDGKYIMDIETTDMDEFEAFVTRAMTEDYSQSGLAEYEASGLYTMLASDWGVPTLVKGQLCGPVTLSLSIFDKSGKPVIYDDTVTDLITKHIKLKAMWLENELRKISPNTLICFDEPSLTAYGSGFFSCSPDRLTALIAEVESSVQGLSAVHSCGDTFWPIVTSTNVDILSLDAIDYGQRLNLYAPDLANFFNRGGSIAWGIIPTAAEKLQTTNAQQLSFLLKCILDRLVSNGIDEAHLYANSFITPACGLAGLDEKDAETALALTNELANLVRR